MSASAVLAVAGLASTGTLRASINLGNAVLTNGTFGAPAGVSVDLAVEVARRLAVPLELLLFGAARESVEAVRNCSADIGFLAIDPARSDDLAFTPPYVIIEGAYAVPTDSPLRRVADVDRDGVRVGAKLGSAYDLHLTRTLAHAEVIRGSDGVDVFAEQGLEVAAGIRQPIEAYVGAHPGLRVLEGSFMQIPQAVAISRRHDEEVIAWLCSVIADLTAGGWVAESLARHGHDPALAAAPIRRP